MKKGPQRVFISRPNSLVLPLWMFNAQSAPYFWAHIQNKPQGMGKRKATPLIGNTVPQVKTGRINESMACHVLPSHSCQGVEQ